MFVDWTTVSFGKLENEFARIAVFDSFDRLSKREPEVFMRTTFGSHSVCFPGKFWQRDDETLRMEFIDDALHWCATARVTRVDFAHDWTPDDFQLAEIWRAVSHHPLLDTRLNGRKGKTWYIGSRESGRFARLYNKRDEIIARTGVDVGFDVLRFEAEIKDDGAAPYFWHWRRAPEIVQSDLAQRYLLEKFLVGNGDVIRVKRPPPADPFAFIRQFRNAIQKARLHDPALFDSLIRPPCG